MRPPARQSFQFPQKQRNPLPSARKGLVMAARKTPSRGTKPDKLMRDALLLALHRETNDANGAPMKKISLVADRLVDMAIDGDLRAIKTIIDRVDGKTPQNATEAARTLEDLLEQLDSASTRRREPAPNEERNSD
jgi:hypothetical protein